MSGYSLDNTWDQANQRLALLEGQLDPISLRAGRRLAVLGSGGRRRFADSMALRSSWTDRTRNGHGY
jgi:hypothetical protein